MGNLEGARRPLTSKVLRNLAENTRVFFLGRHIVKILRLTWRVK